MCTLCHTVAEPSKHFTTIRVSGDDSYVCSLPFHRPGSRNSMLMWQEEPRLCAFIDRDRFIAVISHRITFTEIMTYATIKRSINVMENASNCSLLNCSFLLIPAIVALFVLQRLSQTREKRRFATSSYDWTDSKLPHCASEECMFSAQRLYPNYFCFSMSTNRYEIHFQLHRSTLGTMRPSRNLR